MHGPTCIFRANLTPFSPQVTIMLISPDTPRWIVEADEVLQYRVLARCRGSWLTRFTTGHCRITGNYYS